MNDRALEAAGWEVEEATWEDIRAAYYAATDEARVQRESEFEAFAADMADLPPWPTDEEIAAYERAHAAQTTNVKGTDR